MLKDRDFLVFVARFLGLFILLYFGTLAMIGLAAPGGYYSAFVDRYLDYVSGIKHAITWCVHGLMGLFGVSTKVEPGFVVRVTGGRGVFIAMDCVGYGVYSFWLAWTLAHQGPMARNLMWAIGGLLFLFLVNVLRISGFLWVINHDKRMPLGIDHHTWFNIVAYTFIFGMMYLFNKKNKPLADGPH